MLAYLDDDAMLCVLRHVPATDLARSSATCHVFRKLVAHVVEARLAEAYHGPDLSSSLVRTPAARFLRFAEALQSQHTESVAAGAQHTLCISASAAVQAWGGTHNLYDPALLGNGSCRGSPLPITVAHELKNASQVHCGGKSSFVITEDGAVWAWGKAVWGVLGLPRMEDVSSPCAVPVFQPPIRTAQIACGGTHTLMLSETGVLFTCGMGLLGELGRGSEPWWQGNVSYQGNGLGQVPLGQRVVHVGAGAEHSAAVTETGRLYTWGHYGGESGSLPDGRLGLPNVVDNVSLPQQVQTPFQFRSVACGKRHTLAVTVEAGLVSFGVGRRGALGHGGKNNEPSPKLITNLSDVVHAVAGEYHSACILKGGSLLLWGHGNDGQLGSARTNLLHPTPVEVSHLDETRFCDVSCGHSHTVARLCSGRVVTFGCAFSGRLGHTKTVGQGLHERCEKPSLIEPAAEASSGEDVEEVEEEEEEDAGEEYSEGDSDDSYEYDSYDSNEDPWADY